MKSNPRLTSLTEINTDDMLKAWGLSNVGFGRFIFRSLARPAALGFAREVLKFDHAVGNSDLNRAGIQMCRRFSGGVRVSGMEHVPSKGPVLILSNHPGLTDTIALFAAIQRSDLHVIAQDRPFLRVLTNTSRRIYPIGDNMQSRIRVARSALKYIRKGGALLFFPAGHIEPDPLAREDAMQSLENWSGSIGLFTRLIPEMRIVVAMVGGVFHPKIPGHPLTRLRRRKKDRELLGAALQMAWKPYQRNVVSIAFAPPLSPIELIERFKKPPAITRAITDVARGLLVNWPRTWQTLVPGPGLPPPGGAGSISNPEKSPDAPKPHPVFSST